MKRKKIRSIMRLFDVAALALVIQTVNTACVWHYHQPNIPKEAEKYRK